MKNILKAEELGLFLFFSVVYFKFYHGTWFLYLSLFFVPDIPFIFAVLSEKLAIIFYNFFHHKGAILVLIMIGYLLSFDILIKVGLIFMAHSCFDRVAGYGLKYFDSLDHTHLGWIGKSKDKNRNTN